MGSGTKTQQVKETSTAKSNTTPTLPSYLQGPTENLFGQIGTLRQPGTYGATTNQRQAFDRAGALGGPNAAMTGGMNGIMNLLGQGGQVAGSDLSPYTNPWENQVVNSATQEIERSRQGAINQGGANATMSGAFGGSRHGVADSLSNDAAFRTTGDVVGGLRSQGYQNAQQMRLADIANALGISQAAVQAGAATGADERANVGMQADLGAQERTLQQETDPEQARAQFLANLQRLYGINGAQLMGSNVDSSGQSTGTTRQNSSTLDQIGQLGGILSNIFAPIKLPMSDRSVKRDIEHRHTDAKGQPWYTFHYLWDAPDSPLHYGVMADEAPAHAVHYDEQGIAHVDYGAL